MIVTAARRTIPIARRAVTTASSTSNLAGIGGSLLLKGCELQICIDRRYARGWKGSAMHTTSRPLCLAKLQIAK